MLRPMGIFVVVAVLIGVACGPSGPTAPELRAGREVYGNVCSTCHGNRGQGGVGPALDRVLSTWPSCADHQRWIALGSEGWKAEVGPTYGANDLEITKVMPGQSDSLTEREIAAVAAFERVEYGGGEVDAVLEDCGLDEPEGTPD
jgi:mono/diheme cytochrome c family protein